MKIKPLGNRILIEKVKVEKRTRTGLILTENIEAENNYAKVLEVSEDVVGKIKRDDTVLVDLSNAMEVRVSGNVKYILDVKDIYAIVGGNDE
ncbi:co-chaperone GroES family protein [Streptobacillus moniliformis]|uniref:co-chaperone GroES family protein n=1 Tax=Streptobacillus moniliformis TaxID=34105 RepID=UPI0007E38020|nr:co-chaperone GroES family protein [Streptobacillus moniliformis]QXW66046.1 co-chaperone GroES family protein [Streptobacillus moniliformis]